jgi:hypothetical protein
MSKERPIQYYYEPWLLDLMRSDSEFFRKMGIKACVIDDPCPEPHPVPFPKERRVRLTEKDAQWLKLCGVAWEPEPAFQLAMDFCAPQEGRVGDLDF